jgi:hypothetical protein
MHAATIAAYLFEGNGSASSITSNASADAASWSFTEGGYGFSSSSGTAYVRSSTTGVTFNPDHYLEITIVAAPGYVLNLSSFSFDMGGSSTGGAYTALSQIRTSAGSDPFDTSLLLTPGDITEVGTNVANGSTTLATYMADLSGAQYQGLESITIRAYIYDEKNSSAIFDRFDNFIVQGSVDAIPEPASAPLMLIVCSSGLYLLRKRGHSGRSR